MTTLKARIQKLEHQLKEPEPTKPNVSVWVKPDGYHIDAFNWRKVTGETVQGDKVLTSEEFSRLKLHERFQVTRIREEPGTDGFRDILIDFDYQGE